ncbi:MAG: hypothetical protein DRN96_07195 [Thermoproteota archaeon]|nr:MAG: hypothetical protein DRN96_07195 [Candidatus Korarchaeota archaeon]
MSVVVVDSEYRIHLGREIRAKVGVEKGDRLLAIPFKGGLILVLIGGRKFSGRLDGFSFREEEHEASKLLFGGGDACS